MSLAQSVIAPTFSMARADGFRELYSWFDVRDVLIVQAEWRELLVIVTLSLASEITQTADKQRGH